jgi:solute carrier family 25 carnitine/acylcarnitine transporter 20/29
MEKNELLGLLPGLIQGITRVFISYPADVVKIQMQKQLFTTTKQTVQYMIKNDIRKFYRGSSISFATVGLERSLQYYYLEKINKIYNPYLSGFIVSFASSIYNLPMQYLTTNIALLNKGHNLTQYINQTTYKDLYKGYFIETPKNILGSTIYLGTYFKLRSMTENSSLYPYFGGISGTVTWLVIFPIDTIKTEYQTTKNIKLSSIIYSRFNNDKKKPLEGIKSFYKGLTPILLRTFPSAFAGMYMYEKVRSFIN